jgi:hypothetical protein
MPTYRAYRLDGARRIRSGVWVKAANDAEAKSKAEELCDPDTPHVEVWKVDDFIDEVDCGEKDEE